MSLHSPRRVLFIGIDGLRPDCLKKYAPNIYKYGMKNHYFRNSQVEIPLSSPSWATIFSGLSSKRTGITNNNFQGLTFSNKDNNLENNKENTIFNYICKKKRNPGADKKSVMISSGPWNGIHIICNYKGNTGYGIDDNIRIFNNHVQKNIGKKIFEKESLDMEYKSEKKTLEHCLRYIDNSDYNFVGFYSHIIDSIGHSFGHDCRVKKYTDTIKKIDILIKKLLDKIEDRRGEEEWMVIITTDHGGSSRKYMKKTERGLKLLEEFDKDKQINVVISQCHSEGIHGLKNMKEHTNTFIIISRNRKQNRRTNRKTNRRKNRRTNRRTNRKNIDSKDISPTIIKFLLKNSKNKENILKNMEGKPII